MDTPATEGVDERGSRPSQGLPFSGRHLCDRSGGHHESAKQLDIVENLAVDAADCFSAEGEASHQQVG
jgi:hypothetical protein